MLTVLAGRLNHPALERARRAEAAMLAVGRSPAAFSVFNIEQAYMNHAFVMDDIASRFDLDLRAPWQVDLETGDIIL